MKNTLTLVVSRYMGNQRIGFTRWGTQYGVIISRLRSRRDTTTVLASRPLAFCDQVIILYQGVGLIKGGNTSKHNLASKIII